MKVTREEDNALFTLIKVMPWPEQRFAADVTVVQEKNDSGEPVNRVRVHYGQFRLAPQAAREFAQAILRACDIAEQLERDGSIVLEGEQ